MSYYSLLMGAGFGIIVVAVIIIIAWCSMHVLML